jgi:hypothetical protein
VPSDSGSTPQTGKVIELRGHQAAEHALDALIAASPSHPHYALLLDSALSAGPPLLGAVVRHLDAASPRQLEILGQLVAAYPDRAEAVSALWRAAADRRNTDNRRMGAMLVLDHFLASPPPDDFLSTLREPTRMVLSILTGALRDSAEDPRLLHDYLRVLISQPADLLYSMLGVLADAPGDTSVEVLSLLALQPDPELRLGVVDALAAQASPRAICALTALEPNLPPETARAVGRTLQKLRLSGLDTPRPHHPNAGCRALLSAIDGRGNRLLWLAVPSPHYSSDVTAYMGLMINDTTGLQDAVGSARTPIADFPAHAPIGTLHLSVGSDLTEFAEGGNGDGSYLPCLEVPFEYGLQVVRDAVRRSWAIGSVLPVEYQLLHSLFWDYAANLQEAELPRPLQREHQLLADNESDLLFNPLFGNWYLEGDEVDRIARELGSLDGGIPRKLTDEDWRVLLPALIRLAHDEFSPDLRKLYANRLRLMSEWLWFAGQYREADWAASACQTMLNSPPEANLFVLRLVQKGILVALNGWAGVSGSTKD